MTVLDLLYEHSDFIRQVIPFIRNGIFIDTSILIIFVDGFITLRFSNKSSLDYDNLLSIFDYLKLNNKWSKLFITPHIFAEICRHIHTYRQREDYKQIIGELIPIFKEIGEHSLIDKNRLLDSIDLNRPIMEIGDMSVFLKADEFSSQRKKTAILVKDDRFNYKYRNNPEVLIIDFDKTVTDLTQ